MSAVIFGDSIYFVIHRRFCPFLRKSIYALVSANVNAYALFSRRLWLDAGLGNPTFGRSVSAHLLNMTPYIVTLRVLLFIGRSHAPAAGGNIYDPAAG
ncbi:MAG: hypothetical protein LBH85_07005 [Treponema sp.]|jgi:ABC-type uncharacterized transport system permease subunit|nr:hypothetical protein [Treponema sp.]